MRTEPGGAFVLEGQTVGPRGTRALRIGVEDGVFVEPRDDLPVRAFTSGLLLPAGIDMHVHFRDPGAPQKEDFQTGTTAAAFGGIALVVDMPNTDPVTSTVDAYEAKLRAVRRKAVVDFGLAAGVDAKLRVFELGRRPLLYKLYAGPTTGDMLVEDEATWIEAARRATELGRPMSVHAEHPRLLEEARERAGPPDDPASHTRARPERAETAALAVLARAGGALVHVAHASHPNTLAAARRHGFSAEVAPHHLFLSTDDLPKLGAYGKMNPPLRDPRARTTLLAAFAADANVAAASDHAPHTIQEKEAGFAGAPSGVPGVETMYPMLLAAAFAGEFPIARAVEACASRPADILGLRRGRLEVGFAADFIHVTDTREPVRAERLHSRCGWTPFEGREAVFPQSVYVRGRPVVQDGELVAAPGDGAAVEGV